MIAPDTNVLARAILRDDAEQSATARSLLAEQQVFLSIAVLMELGWVLFRVARLDRGDVAFALRTLASGENVSVEHAERIGWAIDRFEAGADWGDMLLLIAAHENADAFATIDRRLAREAGPDTPVAVETLA